MKLTSGHGLVESVRVRQGRIWFADWTAGTILATDASGRTDEIAHVSSLPLCFDFADDGSLLILDSAHDQVLRRTGAETERWVDLSDLGLSAGNEIIADARGGAFLNFGNFDPRQGFPDQQVGAIAHVAPDGAVSVVARDLGFPNGMGLVDGGSTLLVAESHAHRITGFAIGDHGRLTERRTWADLGEDAPDGIAVTPDDTCWYADVPHRCVVHIAPGGHELDRIDADQGCFSCAWSEADRTIYVASADWPGTVGLSDPAHRWDGTITAYHVGR